MSKRVPIIDRLRTGDEVDLSLIDDEIDAWHESASKLPLYQWLGFTKAEYARFVEQPSSIHAVLDRLRQGIPVNE